MRRNVAALEKLVIVESPNKVIKVEGLLSDASVIPDWSFKQEHLRRLGVGAEKAVAMATTGHFMAMKEIKWAPRTLAFSGDANETLALGEEPFPPNGTLAEYTLEWQMLPGRRIQETLERYLQEKLNNVTEIILATDPDREGELIAVHTLQTIKRLYPKLKVPYSRAYMHSITEDGIRKAMQERLVDKCDYDLANAAETRHAMDRIFGFLGSSVVRAANSQMRSIGRVQTPALILIHEREEKNAAFLEKNKTTYLVEAMCHFPGPHGTTFSQVVTITPDLKEEVVSWDTEVEAKRCLHGWKLNRCSDFSVPYEPLIVPSEVPPPQPFTMATAIARANRQLKMSSETVSSCLQDLFQLGYITYPRTDSTRIDVSALTAIYATIKKDFGKEMLYRLEDRTASAPEGRKSKRSGKKKSAKHAKVAEHLVGNVEDAHEAIRPTSIHADGNSLSLPPITRAVYDLVRCNTLASFMIPMRSEKITATVKFTSGSGDKLRVVLEGKRVVEPGWMRAFQKTDTTAVPAAATTTTTSSTIINNRNATSANTPAEEEENEDITEKEGAPVIRSLSQEEFRAIAQLRSTLATSRQPREFDLRSPTVRENRPVPPLPHSEGTLIEELKNNGVGRPSTYPMIVKTLLTRGYIEVNPKGRCETTPIGRLLVSTAKLTFPSIVDIGFTASFEKKLDLIAKPNPEKRPKMLRGTNVSQADYFLSMFLSTFLNYVAEATRTQRANIVERSMRLKHEQQEGSGQDKDEFEESVANARKKVALATGDLAAFPKTYHNFTALQRGLHDYLRRHFPPSRLSSLTPTLTSADGSKATMRMDGASPHMTSRKHKWEKSEEA
ncbi:topoisomerase IAmt [Trypanosoma rangeli]|uniref:DNA topoisomerase n=1 Tax=Trypanosoma rangeli TaxID=5698 RepID=A0A422N774_TRYRA|nr:topoisomerase IAmt [Trypanosoma rangeli]RNF01323.1 topoisomerase IAmt [Trypanosoma rangeli]|eukprot:RNF01323.1 topoisomerase IAmt [Trypanosoma rangeli]